MKRPFILLGYFLLFLSFVVPVEAISQGAKGQHMRMHTIPVTSKKSRSKPDQSLPRIGFVALQANEMPGGIGQRAFEALSNVSGLQPVFLAFEDIKRSPKKINSFDILWFHGCDSLSDGTVPAGLRTEIIAFTNRGGKLFLTQGAVHYLNSCGFEAVPLSDSVKQSIDEGYGRNLGFHAFRDHPVFEGLNGGAYVLKPLSDCAVRISGFFGQDKPAAGSVVAVDWDYIFLREHSKLILEYQHGEGKILAVGGYMEFGIPNRNSLHLAKFLENCLRYLLGNKAEIPPNYWRYEERSVTECPAPPESDRLIREPSPAQPWRLEDDPLALKRNFATEHFWDVAGERMVSMGTEAGGIEEVWAHPFMALRDFVVGIRFSYKDTIYWLNDERPEISVNPAFFSREYKFRRGYLREILVVDPVHPAGVVHYEYRGVYPAELIIRFTSNLRLMWPYSDEVTGSVCHRFDPDLSATLISNMQGDMHVMIGANRTPSYHLEGRFDGFFFNRDDSSFSGITTSKLQAGGLLVYKLGMNDNLDLVYAASSGALSLTYEAYVSAVHNPYAILEAAKANINRILTSQLMVTSPDEIFNTGYRWAALAADRFAVYTPGMGKALVAGYATTRKGWNGGHAVNGRPGYGWYFGRDAEWSSFALLAQGNFALVRSQLNFFEKYQDLTGKIFHEASTSGIVHYDAADATPLYLLLAGRYFRHTADTAYLKEAWPSISKAIDFCYSTDTDQDKLIENTNVGHGWVEGGGLYGSHSTIYMAGIWGAALKEVSNMAVSLAVPEAEKYRWDSEEQYKLINTMFWSDDTRFFAYGMNNDRQFRREETILPAVPILLKMTDRDKAALCMRVYGGNTFTTNWGVRILREDNPMFKPTGYHYGSVWPLFTGWASLAGYASGSPVQAFSHLMNNLMIYRHWGLGFVEEVMNGAAYQPSGVCPHQCWSETMVLEPVIEGMLGLTVNAPTNQITLSPALPFHWDSLSVANIRIGNRSIDFTFVRDSGAYRYSFFKSSGQTLRVGFMPVLAPGTVIKSVSVNGKEVPYTTFRGSNSISVMTEFECNGIVNLAVAYEGGAGVMPVVADPKEGDTPEGLRLLASDLRNETYTLELEGLSGTSNGFSIWTGPGVKLKPYGAKETGKTNQVVHYTIDFENGLSKYSDKTVSFEIVHSN